MPENDTTTQSAEYVLNESELSALVLNEKSSYEKNSRDMRTILKRAYRNFLGIFDEPNTRYTKRKKEFWNLTQYHSLTSASRVYVDPRAITILPRVEEDIPKAKVWGDLIPFQLNQMNFFQDMNKFGIELALFGTGISAQDWEFKKEKYIDRDGKAIKTRVQEDRPSYKSVPLLNCYLDMTAETLQDSPSFIVETWHEASELPKLKERYKWKTNVNSIEGIKLITADGKLGQNDLLQYQQMGISQKQLEVPMVSILWRWGKIKLSWVTKKESDENEWVEGIIALLNKHGDEDDDKSAPVILDIRVNPFDHGKRPFEECWYIKIPGRWYGLGVGEMLLDPQSYLNRVINQRIDNNEILQNKMYKVRRGAGLDNKSIAAAPGKAISVQNMDDIQVLETGDAKTSSYNDEQNILVWAERQTHIKDASSSAKSATEAQINAELAGDFFAIVRRNINDYLRRVVWQIIELDKQFIDKEIVIRIVGEPSDFKEFDQMRGVPDFVARDMGNMRFIQVKDIKEIDGQYDIEVEIDNSAPMNKALRTQGLQQLIQLALQDPNSGINRAEAYKEYAQELGLKGSRFFLNTENQSFMPLPGQQVMGGQQAGASPQGTPMPGVPTNAGGIAQNLQGRVGTDTMFEQSQ